MNSAFPVKTKMDRKKSIRVIVIQFQIPNPLKILEIQNYPVQKRKKINNSIQDFNTIVE